MNYFITNREIIVRSGKELIREDGKEHAGDNVRFGKFDKGKFELFPEPDKENEIVYSELDKTPTKDLKGSSRFFKEIYDELIKMDPGNSHKSDVLFFIHGFNTNLDDVRSCFNNLINTYVNDPGSPIKHIVVFTWPSKSPSIPMHYVNDKFDAMRSGEVLARCFGKVMEFLRVFLKSEGNPGCNRNIHLMVHSMGHRVLKHMMLSLEKRYEFFKEIILLAADIEYTIFEQDEAFNSLIDMGSRIHIYYHENDKVLDISKYTKNFSNRLGRYGRKRIDPTLKDVTDVNVTATQYDAGTGIDDKLLNHWYYYTSSQVVRDVIAVLNGKNSNLQ